MNLRCTAISDLGIEYESRDGDWKLDVRRDGCVHIKRFHNGSRADAFGNPDMDYLHVCDLDEFVAALSKLAKDTKVLRESV